MTANRQKVSTVHQVSFGNMLKEARIARGMNVPTVARELRIRQDIIRAIEEADFDRMPSRGYTRNMVIAYARLVGLNAQNISRMYLDQEYAHQVEQAHRTTTNAVELHRRTQRASATTSFAPVGNGVRSRRHHTPTWSSSRGEDWSRTPYAAQQQSVAYDQRNAHRARRSAISEGKYTNLYSAPRNIPNPNARRNTVVVVVACVVVVIALALAFFFSHRPTAQTNIPVTGAPSSEQKLNTTQDTTTTQTQQQTTTDETAPTKMTLTYSVADGSDSYIEVYVDGATKESHDVSGPATQSYTSSDTIRFVTTETKGVTLKVNDEEIALKTNDKGIYNHTFKFSDVLDEWYTAHPNVSRPDSDTTSTDSSDATDSYQSSSSAE